MIPQYPNFKSLELENLASIKQHLASANHRICELALANLFIWQDFDHPKLTLINNNLCIFITPPNEPPFFLEPIGKHKIIDTLNTCLKDCGRVCRASEDFVLHLPLENYQLKCERNHFDYTYDTKALAELKGRRYDGKRNHIKNFKKRHPEYVFAPLKKEHREEVLRLFEAWVALHHLPKLAYTSQKNALNKAFECFTALNLLGGAIYINQEMQGFILGSNLGKNTISVHFQYGHPALRGIFQTLLWEACTHTFKASKYINLEQDLGIPGLRKAKLSYYPERLEKKFEIT